MRCLLTIHTQTLIHDFNFQLEVLLAISPDFRRHQSPLRTTLSSIGFRVGIHQDVGIFAPRATSWPNTLAWKLQRFQNDHAPATSVHKGKGCVRPLPGGCIHHALAICGKNCPLEDTFYFSCSWCGRSALTSGTFHWVFRQNLPWSRRTCLWYLALYF